MKKLSLIIFLISMAWAASAQMKKASEAFSHHHYEEAIELYNQVIRKDLDNDEAITNLAVCYWKTDQYSLAEYWFQRAALMNDDPIVKLWYSQLLISNEKYLEAKGWLDKYAQTVTDPEMARQAKKMAVYCDGLSRGITTEFACDIYPVPFNSEELDFAPFVIGDMLLFTSNREGAQERRDENDPWTKSRFTDVFVAQREGANTFSTPVPLGTEVLSTWHEGPVSLSTDQQVMFLTRSNVDNKKRQFDESRNTRLKISVLRKGNSGHWTDVREFPYNSREYNTGHAISTPDGRWLIFSSDMPGGTGGMDLYRCSIDEDGSFGKPENLGKQINTRGNEIFPYVARDGRLYFSSDLHLGFGDLDIYVSEKTPQGWGNPQNMGAPINSPKDDFGISLDETGESGFFSSNRNVASKDDILYFEYSSTIMVEGVVINCETREPIANAEVHVSGTAQHDDVQYSRDNGTFDFTVPYRGVYQLLADAPGYLINGSCAAMEVIDCEHLNSGDKIKVTLALSPEEYTSYSDAYVCGRITNERYGNPLGEALLTIMNHCTGEMSEAKTDASGAYFIPIDKNCNYTLRASKRNFDSLQATFTPTINESSCHEVNIALKFLSEEPPALLTPDVPIEKGMILELFHIYFDLDEAELKEDNIPDLQTLLTILKEHPGMTGELMAHTDSRASDEYNLELSQRRAEAAKTWLIKNGIAPDRLSAKGYGETQLKNECSDGVECSEKQHKRNRRVEFRITEIERGIDEVSAEKLGIE